MKRKAHHVSIRPADNGGHTVTVDKDSPMGSGKYEPPTDHVFGADEHDKMIAHVKSSLGLGETDETSADEAKESPAKQKVEAKTGTERHKGAAIKAMKAFQKRGK